MAVAYDAESVLGNGTGDRNFTHTPTGTPRGVIVLIHAKEGTDQNPSVTYGGVSMTEASASPKSRNLGDTHTIYGFVLGASIPTGAQTVAISRGGAAAAYRAECFTVTASADTEEANSNGGNNATANPSTSLTVARTSFVAGSIGDDSATTGTIGVGTVLDTQVQEIDFGVYVGGTYRASSLQTGTFSADWTAGATGHAFLAVAIQEVAGVVTLGALTPPAVLGSLRIDPSISLGGLVPGATLGSITVNHSVTLAALSVPAIVEAIQQITQQVVLEAINTPATAEAITASQAGGAQTVDLAAITAAVVASTPQVNESVLLSEIVTAAVVSALEEINQTVTLDAILVPATNPAVQVNQQVALGAITAAAVASAIQQFQLAVNLDAITVAATPQAITVEGGAGGGGGGIIYNFIQRMRRRKERIE